MARLIPRQMADADDENVEAEEKDVDETEEMIFSKLESESEE